MPPPLRGRGQVHGHGQRGLFLAQLVVGTRAMYVGARPVGCGVVTRAGSMWGSGDTGAKTPAARLAGRGRGRERKRTTKLLIDDGGGQRITLGPTQFFVSMMPTGLFWLLRRRSLLSSVPKWAVLFLRGHVRQHGLGVRPTFDAGQDRVDPGFSQKT